MTQQQATETLTFSLNNNEVTVPKGWTVMQAAAREGIKIPHFCWHPGLSIAGVCRFCMVKVEGRPKLEIACNLIATPGMQVTTETEEVKAAHKWALEFHLINHPLDCPICDQAGECSLQDYYMSVGKYKSEMTLKKVLKPKALDVGGDLVLDTERCILCSRCVRFEKEVTKTGALGIFDRGDRAIISIYDDKKISHNYTTNLVDICPVGAFTSKDFRFRKRVWFLKDIDTTCPGCSTGCQVKLYSKPEERRYYRIKPRFSETNGHWMCDEGRHLYAHMNPEKRQRTAFTPKQDNERGSKEQRVRADIRDALAFLKLKMAKYAPSDIALLVSSQLTNEEYKKTFAYFVTFLGVKKVFAWRDSAENIEAFDGLLNRGDKNPNTKGHAASLEAVGLPPVVSKSGFADAMASGAKFFIAIAPENTQGFVSSFDDQLKQLSAAGDVALFTSQAEHAKNPAFDLVVPLKCFGEKSGTFLNAQNMESKLAEKPFFPLNDQVKDLVEITALLQEN